MRVVWNRTLAARHARYHIEGKSTSYAETDRALTEMKKQSDLAFLGEVSSVPLQQTLRHQHNALVGNRKLARAISCTGWAEFRELLTYKAHRDGRHLAVVDRWYPSSKTCSACGHLLATLSLGTRRWTCPNCGTLHDRDVNAAKNIAVAAGLAETKNACGADVRHEGQPSVQCAMNQEHSPARVGIPAL
ncbi:RNA-guided endonuclease TnpB family protein [Micromonospora sp. IBHARD004]|uniref:RNA-guided endonuclease TnpB family protein n=1 Tax=Micromonospora sp. IBHARD004 TaxID=3457764 RepID=UPI004057E10C